MVTAGSPADYITTNPKGSLNGCYYGTYCSPPLGTLCSMDSESSFPKGMYYGNRGSSHGQGTANWGKDVLVWSEEVSEPVAVRYAFRNWGPGNLKSNFGIPAVPFRTDDWDDLER